MTFELVIKSIIWGHHRNQSVGEEILIRERRSGNDKDAYKVAVVLRNTTINDVTRKMITSLSDNDKTFVGSVYRAKYLKSVILFL